MEFKKIEKQNIADKVFEILKQKILDGSLQAGDKLPAESKLSEELGVSKSSIRVAIQRLNTLGLVETKPGDGSYVKTFQMNTFLDQMYEFILTDNDIKDITEYRLATEMACTQVAIAKATAKDYQKLEHIVYQMNQALRQQDVAKHSICDFQFHLEVCKMTRNPIFIMAYETIGNMLRQHTTILNDLYLKKYISQNPEDDVHWRLMEAMKKNDLDLCRKCYIEMFSVYQGNDEVNE